MTETHEESSRFHGFGDWFRHPAEILFVVAALALFVHVYMPCARKRAARQSDAKTIRTRVDALQTRIQQLELHAAALEGNDRDTLREVIREELRKGQRGERVLPFLPESHETSPMEPPAVSSVIGTR